MNHYDVKRLALVLAVQAEIEGMKAKNRILKFKGSAILYYQKDFNKKAEELRNIANAHDEQL